MEKALLQKRDPSRRGAPRRVKPSCAASPPSRLLQFFSGREVLLLQPLPLPRLLPAKKKSLRNGKFGRRACEMNVDSTRNSREGNRATQKIARGQTQQQQQRRQLLDSSVRVLKGVAPFEFLFCFAKANKRKRCRLCFATARQLTPPPYGRTNQFPPSLQHNNSLK